MTESSSRAGAGQGGGRASHTVAIVVAIIVVVVILATGFVPAIAVTGTSTSTFQTSNTIVNRYTTTTTGQSITTVQNQVYSITAYTLNCNTYGYVSAQLDQGWNLVVTYSTGDTITVYLMNSQQFTSFEASTNNPSTVASQSGLSSGQFGYNVPLTDTYYLVFYNNLHNGILCVGGEKVTINSAVGMVTYTQTLTTSTEITLYSTSTTYYNTSSAVMTTKTVGWICDLANC